MFVNHDDRELFPWLRRLVKSLEPEAVFMRNLHVAIILSNKKQLPLKEYKTKLDRCRLPTTISYAMHYGAELERQFNLGNLFLTTFCVERNSVYNTKEEGTIPLWLRWRLLKRNSLNGYNNGMATAGSFYKGACFYWSTGDYTMAAYMLHQAIELCFRAVIIAFTETEVKTHAINELLQHIKKLLPELATLMRTKKEAHKRAFEKLENAYCGARYNEAYTISEEEVRWLLCKVKEVHECASRQMANVFQLFDV